MCHDRADNCSNAHHRDVSMTVMAIMAMVIGTLSQVVFFIAAPLSKRHPKSSRNTIRRTEHIGNDGW